MGFRFGAVEFATHFSFFSIIILQTSEIKSESVQICVISQGRLWVKASIFLDINCDTIF